VLCIPMIETRQAVERVEEIVAVPGVDAVYVGPSDLSVTLGLPPGPDQPDPVFGAALKRIVAACHASGVIPGIAGNPTLAPRRLGQGFLFVEVASQAVLLARGAAEALGRVRSSRGDEETAYL